MIELIRATFADIVLVRHEVLTVDVVVSDLFNLCKAARLELLLLLELG